VTQRLYQIEKTSIFKMRLVKVLEMKGEDFFTDFTSALTLKWAHNSVLGVLEARIIPGWASESCSGLFNIRLDEQTLLIFISPKLSSLIPLRHQKSKSRLRCFPLSLPGISTLRILLILSSTSPKSHHQQNSTPGGV